MMALKKTLRSIHGIDVNYWIVKDVVIDRIRKMARIAMGGYPTQDIRNEDADPLMKLTVNINFEKYEEFFSLERLELDGNNPYKAAYESIKKYDSFFKDGEDIV